jgi:predicted Rossmann fold flavoprotein
LQNNYDVIVVGGGPAGIIAAGRAAQLGAKVLVVEKMRQAGRKLLITGKGRCNITNNAPVTEYFKNIFPQGRFLKHAFDRFFNNDIIQLLNEQGVETIVERGDRVFPVSDSAADVLQGLLKWMNRNKVEIIYEAKVNGILTEANKVTGITIQKFNQESRIDCKNVIICTGGRSYPATGSTGDGYLLAQSVGHTIEEARPSLVPIVTKGTLAADLQGLSLKNVNAIVWVNGKKHKEAFGEMLFAHFGLTGPIILTLSRFVVDEIRKKNKVEISIDLKPALDEQKLDARLVRDLNENGKKQIENVFKLWLPSKLIPVFMQILQIDGNKLCHQMNAKERRSTMLLMKNFRFEVIDFRGFKEAIITAGGVSLHEIDSRSMESRIIKNLFFAGEVIDLDANTGGFNLQIAYSTAWLAAESAADISKV